MQVECALYLWETGAFTIKMLGFDSKAPKLAKTLNKATRKKSNYEHSFSEANYSNSTRYYCVQVNMLKQSSMEYIVTKANSHYHKMNKKAMKSITTIINVDLPNSCPVLINLSD